MPGEVSLPGGGSARFHAGPARQSVHPRAGKVRGQGDPVPDADSTFLSSLEEDRNKAVGGNLRPKEIYNEGAKAGRTYGNQEAKDEASKSSKRWVIPLVVGGISLATGALIVAIWAHYHDKNLIKKLAATPQASAQSAGAS